MKKTALILAVVMMAATTAAAPSDSRAGMTPDNPFYFAEQISESLELAVAKAPVIGSSELEAKVRANQADERLAEAQKLLEKNRTEKAEKMMKRYSRQMNKSYESAGKANNPELSNRLNNVSRNHLEVLKEVERKTPGPAKKGIQNAIKNSQRNQRKFEPPAQRPEDTGKPETGSRGKKPDTGKGKQSDSPKVEKPDPIEGPTVSGEQQRPNQKPDRQKAGSESQSVPNSSGGNKGAEINTGADTGTEPENRSNMEENGSRVTGEATERSSIPGNDQGQGR